MNNYRIFVSNELKRLIKTILVIMFFLYSPILIGQEKNQYETFNSSSDILILNYDDFGPQVLKYEFIGYEWWQWESHGDSDPKINYDIRIIVFRNISLEKVKVLYPINKDKSIDFRYTSYNSAIQYLNNITKAYSEDFKVEQYVDLKEKIIAHFETKE